MAELNFYDALTRRATDASGSDGGETFSANKATGRRRRSVRAAALPGPTGRPSARGLTVACGASCLVTIFVTMSKSRMPTAPAKIAAGEFKAKCLELMDSVARTGATVVITKRGVPVARLGPAGVQEKLSFGCLRGAFEEAEDIVAPLAGDWSMRDERASLVSSEASRHRRRASHRRSR